MSPSNNRTDSGDITQRTGDDVGGDKVGRDKITQVFLGPSVEELRATTKKVDIVNDSLISTQSKIKALENSLQELGKRLNPRVISSGQVASLKASLQSIPEPRIAISYPIGNGESYVFSQQIQEVFKLVGWEVEIDQKWTIGTTALGNFIIVSSLDEPEVMKLQQAFSKAGIPMEIHLDRDGKFSNYTHHSGILVFVGERL